MLQTIPKPSRTDDKCVNLKRWATGKVLAKTVKSCESLSFSVTPTSFPGSLLFSPPLLRLLFHLIRARSWDTRDSEISSKITPLENPHLPQLQTLHPCSCVLGLRWILANSWTALVHLKIWTAKDPCSHWDFSLLHHQQKEVAKWRRQSQERIARCSQLLSGPGDLQPSVNLDPWKPV